MAYVLDDRFLQEQFVRASGPGGQNVNKVATAVQLRFDVDASDLPADVKARLRSLAGNRLDSDGRVLIDSREHRTQTQNREAARVRLQALIAQAFVRPRPRRATKPKASSKEQRLTTKKQRGAVKAGRSTRVDRDD